MKGVMQGISAVFGAFFLYVGIGAILKMEVYYGIAYCIGYLIPTGGFALCGLWLIKFAVTGTFKLK